MWWNVLKGVGIVLVVALIAFGVYMSPQMDKHKIDRWCAEHDYEVISSRKPWFSTGPFSFVDTDSETVYKVHVRDKRTNATKVIWFRFGMFGMTDWHEENVR